MAYTSGRTVKSSKPTPETVRRRATKTVRVLVNAYFGAEAPLFTIDTTLTAAQYTLAPQTRTVITFPAYVNADELEIALRGLPGFSYRMRSRTDITIVRDI